MSESQYPKYQVVNASGSDTAGSGGATLITDTALRNGNWYAIAIVQTAVFDTLAAANWDGNTTSGLSISSGQVHYGAFTAIKLISGAVIAYK